MDSRQQCSQILNRIHQSLMLIMPSESKKWIFENSRWKQRLLFRVCCFEVFAHVETVNLCVGVKVYKVGRALSHCLALWPWIHFLLLSGLWFSHEFNEKVGFSKQASRLFLALIFIHVADIYWVTTMYLALFQALELFREERRQRSLYPRSLHSKGVRQSLTIKIINK